MEKMESAILNASEFATDFMALFYKHVQLHVSVLHSFFLFSGKMPTPEPTESMHLLPFVNENTKIGAGNKWVTLFPLCCLPEINTHFCCRKAYYPFIYSKN